ncbi:phenylacetic acid degradation protein [Acuticoccus sediminis]|uniref:Phenylacetic acid degradation protein n=1 Tax=Acuticoccus sediminis TaxID=2184697 RepID=A0A8B2NGI5_9HYPH|nr:PaaI family thioesterase [Acuticoccus sediminis]RAH98241.1 phenylacetic acid degradation protein [Acuticoccus sediminis]
MHLPDVQDYLAREFPQVFGSGHIVVEAAHDGVATLVLTPGDPHLRPGGIVSGPALMTLADAAAYAALLSLTAEAKMAVTTNLNISFLRAGAPGAPIRLVATVVKPGRRLSVIVAEAFAGDALLAHCTMTYAMPAADVAVVS